MERRISLKVAFGTPPSAWANEELRQKIWAISEGGPGWIYTQPDMGLPPSLMPRVIAEEEGEPSPTLRIARGAVAYAKEISATEIRIVAAKPHMWRCKRDLKMAVREAKTSILVVEERIFEISWWEWFHPSSTQLRTRSPWAWLRREIILWLMPWAIYKRVAS